MPDPSVVELDVSIAGDWWALRASDIPQGVVALWFGIVELHREDRVVRTLYVGGTATFDAGDNSAEWACDPTWLEHRNYVELPGLAALPSSPYTEILAHAAAVVRELRPELMTDAPLVGIGVGFDDGDFEIVWTVNPATSTT